MALVTISSVLSLGYWTTYCARVVNRDEIGHLDGLGQFRLDGRKARILAVLSRLDNQVIIAGRSRPQDTTWPLLVALSHNRAYAAWQIISDWVFYTNGVGESDRRFDYQEALYTGTLTHPLYFLRQANVAAVVIYPDDAIDPSVVEQLKKDLAPYYTYEDACSQSHEEIAQNITSTDSPCAGVFIYHPAMTTLLGDPPEP